MILKSLEMENIRSYVKQKISFPLRTTLFEGDIGSGKSTILNAIEFALFGLGSQKGGSLLRLGTKKGSVTLTFEVDIIEYKIHRSLIRKRKSVRQGDDGYIEMNESRISLSATELKERILDILNFNEPPNPRAQSIIYRYAVFTPQEEMKAILLLNPDKRLQTLRKAFGIEAYKTASENAQNTARVINQRTNFLDGQISDLNQKEELLNQTQAEIRKVEDLSENLQNKEEKLDQKLNETNEQLDEFKETRRKIENIKAQIPHYEREIRDKTNRLDDMTQENIQMNNKIGKNQPTVDELAKLACPTDKTENELEEELKKARNEDRKIRREDIQIEVKINDYASIEQNEICPTCDRPADPKEFKQKIEEKNKERKAISKRIQDQGELINGLEKLQLKLRGYITTQKELEGLQRQIDEWNRTIQKNSKEIKTLKGEVGETRKKLNSALTETKDLESVSKNIEILEGEKAQLEAELQSTRREINTNMGRVKELKDAEEQLIEEINKKKGQKKKKDKLYDHRIWLSDYFIPTLDIIERNVMIGINQEFNQQYQHWFNILIEDPDLETSIDENFTPIIQREGYDQDLISLSGGEKTSVALAYRLALNTIVQKVSTGMKSNLLILDEPTDGFSKEQLFKMRDILTELRCPQIIIVSHERELESFADQIFQITKSRGVSKIDSME